LSRRHPRQQDFDMRLAQILLIAATPLAIGAAALAQARQFPADFPLPGYWEQTTKVESIIHSNKTEYKCYTAQDVGKLLQPCNHMHVCEYSTKEAKDGRLVLKGRWVNKKDNRVIEVAGVGRYSNDHMTASAEMHTSFLGIPISGTGELSARRVSAQCPPDAKKG
jgi:hypothetical protein